MGHIGLTPQSATKLGGFRAQGRTADAALALYDDALALAGRRLLRARARGRPGAGRGAHHARRSRSRRSASARARTATARCSSGTTCSGMYAGSTPRFVKRYAELAEEIGDALAAYVGDVRSGAFPEEQHTYSIPDEELEELRGGARAQSRQRRRAAAAPPARRGAPRPRAPTSSRAPRATPTTSSATAQARKPSREHLEHACRRRPRRRRRGGRRRRRRARASPAAARATARPGPHANARMCRARR